MPNLARTVIGLDAQYEVQEVVGKGGYGIIYLARDLSSPVSAPVYRAIKVIHANVPGVKGYRTLLRRESRLHKSVSDHPNVVTLHDAWEDDDFVYLVMDYCPGGRPAAQDCRRQGLSAE